MAEFDERDRGAGLVLLDPDAGVPGDDAGGSQPGKHRLVKDPVQPAAMDAHLRVSIARESAAWLLVDKLAEAIEKAALVYLDPGLPQGLVETQRGEFAHRMGQKRDADTEFLDLRSALEHPAGDAPLVQVEGKRKPANAAPNDDNVHGAFHCPDLHTNLPRGPSREQSAGRPRLPALFIMRQAVADACNARVAAIVLIVTPMGRSPHERTSFPPMTSAANLKFLSLRSNLV